MLIGVDLGPNLSVTGSLASILWLVALRQEKVEVSACAFSVARLLADVARRGRGLGRLVAHRVSSGLGSHGIEANADALLLSPDDAAGQPTVIRNPDGRDHIERGSDIRHVADRTIDRAATNEMVPAFSIRRRCDARCSFVMGANHRYFPQRTNRNRGCG